MLPDSLRGSFNDRSTHTLVEDRYVELEAIVQPCCTGGNRQKIRAQNARLATQGLGFAYQYFPHLPDADNAESELLWVGLVVLTALLARLAYHEIVNFIL
jgi:hypothetical protein